MKVLYNEKCPICAFEINQYRKKSEIEFQDCSEMGNKYLRRLHFISNSNELKVGLDAFIEIWSRSEGYEKLAKLTAAENEVKLDRAAFYRYVYTMVIHIIKKSPYLTLLYTSSQ